MLRWVISKKVTEDNSKSAACCVGFASESLEEINERFRCVEKVEKSTVDANSVQKRC